MTPLPWYWEFGIAWAALCVLVCVGWYFLRRGQPRDDGP